jgi:hypothetical protein
MFYKYKGRAGLVAIFLPGVVIEEMQCAVPAGLCASAGNVWQMLDIN